MINWHLHHGNKCRNTETGAEFILDYPYKAYNSYMLRDTCGDSYLQRDCLPEFLKNAPEGVVVYGGK